MEEDDGTLDTAAVGVHEMFESFLRAGFTEDQAFHLITVQWQAIIAGNL